MNTLVRPAQVVPSGDHCANLGRAPGLIPFDIGHNDYLALVAPDSAFWSLVPKARLAEQLADSPLLASFAEKVHTFTAEMENLRFHLKPTAVYFNPTERCNLNCGYCYIPATMRRDGISMDWPTMRAALERLDAYFATVTPEGRTPQIIFHGAEPLLAREAVFRSIDAFGDRFRFGIQTNATLLDDEAIAFLTSRGVGIGLSLDGPVAEIADRTRSNWGGRGSFEAVVTAMRRLRGYPAWNVICTMSRGNLDHLVEMVDFLHREEVPTCMLNVVRCTQPGARDLFPADQDLVPVFFAALERTRELYQETGRKLVVANFANILIAILAPTARRLMCDISPCGGGRSFFALAPSGDLFPCSEFIGLPAFKGGNLFTDEIDTVLDSAAFVKVTGRKVEDIAPCRTCTIRHFCGAPCPAEAHEMNGGMNAPGAYCSFYVEQVRYAFRLIADGAARDFLWDGWDEGTETTFAFGGA